jgi:hypothetical protein
VGVTKTSSPTGDSPASSRDQVRASSARCCQGAVAGRPAVSGGTTGCGRRVPSGPGGCRPARSGRAGSPVPGRRGRRGAGVRPRRRLPGSPGRWPRMRGRSGCRCPAVRRGRGRGGERPPPRRPRGRSAGRSRRGRGVRRRRRDGFGADPDQFGAGVVRGAGSVSDRPRCADRVRVRRAGRWYGPASRPWVRGRSRQWANEGVTNGVWRSGGSRR